jgi:glycosyltransferase involved in cell wall biosynthesis
LPKDQFEVAVALGGNGLLKEKLEVSGIRTISIESMQRDVSLFAEEKAINELRKLFKKEQPDVVHLNSSKAGGLGAFAARMVGIKTIIFTAHGWPFWEKRSFIARALIWYFSWLTALLSTKVIVVSKYDLAVARKMPFCAAKTLLIYNGIAPETLGDGAKIRSAFPPNVHITGTVGELTKNKNQIALIEEAKQKPNMYVAIVGEGELRDFLESKSKEYKLENRVKLFGFLPASEALKGFDTFALPSLKEGLPYVLLEAKAAGLPIIANPVGGIPEILQGKIEDFTLERMVKETAALY